MDVLNCQLCGKPEDNDIHDVRARFYSDYLSLELGHLFARASREALVNEIRTLRSQQ